MAVQDTIAFSPIETGLLAASSVKLPSLKLSKISTKSVDVFVENLGRGKSDRADLGIPGLCLKYRQSRKELIWRGFPIN
jgi:hypothetical protein